MSYRCSNCNGIIYDRRINLCTHCGADLSPILLLLPSEVPALDRSAGGTEVPVALLAQTGVELRKARGHSEATRQAAIRYFREGPCSGFPTGLLFKWLFSWPNKRESVFSQIGYSGQAGKEFVRILKKLTVQEILESSETVPLPSSALSSSSNIATDKAISGAKARIMWGESSSSVREFLTSNGMPDSDADAKIKEFNLERTREIRGIGVKNILIGVVLTGAAGISIYLVIPLVSGSGFAKVLGMLVVGGIYGLWKLVTGVTYLVRPQCARKSISDIME